jgi:hypothetical protein
VNNACRPLDFQRIFSEVTRGDQSAFEFLAAFLIYCHREDDVIDGQPWNHDSFLEAGLEWIRVLSFNEFYQKHKATLFPAIVTSLQEYSDSNKWAKSPDFRERATADVLKSSYQSVWILVAYIIGGHAHMRRISETFRTYDFDYPSAVDKIEAPNDASKG